MKTKAPLLALITISLILGSCGMHTGNFNKQKFTNLKKIERNTEVVSVVPAEIEASEEKSEVFAEDEIVYVEHSRSTETVSEDQINDNSDDQESEFVQVEEIISQTESNDLVITDLSIEAEEQEIVEDETEESEPVGRDAEKEKKLYITMTVFYFLAAIASVFLFFPAIPFYLVCFVCAILLVRRLRTTPREKRTKKEKWRVFFSWEIIVRGIAAAMTGLVLLIINFL